MLLLNFAFLTSQYVARSELVLDNPELLIVIGSRACRQPQLASIFGWNEFSYQNVDHIWFRCGSLLPETDRSVAAAIICRRLSFHMPGLDWELQLRCARRLIPFLPADVREVVACQWMNMGGLLMTNLICFNDVRWNHNWELVVEFPVKYWTSKFSPEFVQRHMSHKKVAYICKTMPQISFLKVPSDRRLWFLQHAFRSAPSHVQPVAS